MILFTFSLSFCLTHAARFLFIIFEDEAALLFWENLSTTKYWFSKLAQFDGSGMMAWWRLRRFHNFCRPWGHCADCKTQKMSYCCFFITCVHYVLLENILMLLGWISCRPYYVNPTKKADVSVCVHVSVTSRIIQPTSIVQCWFARISS